MRGLHILAPRDCCVSNTTADNDAALRQIELVLKGDTTPSDQLAFAARRRAAGRVSSR
jgi:hypothetical protein